MLLAKPWGEINGKKPFSKASICSWLKEVRFRCNLRFSRILAAASSSGSLGGFWSSSAITQIFQWWVDVCCHGINLHSVQSILRIWKSEKDQIKYFSDSYKKMWILHPSMCANSLNLFQSLRNIALPIPFLILGIRSFSYFLIYGNFKQWVTGLKR